MNFGFLICVVFTVYLQRERYCYVKCRVLAIILSFAGKSLYFQLTALYELVLDKGKEVGVKVVKKLCFASTELVKSLLFV